MSLISRQISRHRVIGKTEEELDELTCNICQNIFSDPVVTNCCRQTFCRECITHWVRDNKSCPNDRKQLGLESLSTAPRVLFNLLDLLVVKCEYHSNDCQTVLTSDLIKEHEECCDKNPKNCDSCLKLKAKMVTLVKDKERVIRELNMLKLEKASLTSTHQIISITRNNLNDCRTINSHKLSPTLLEFIIGLCRQSIRVKNSFNEIAFHIQTKMNEYENDKFFGARAKWSVVVTTSDASVLLNDKNKKYALILFHKIICCLIRDKELPRH